MCSQFDYKSKAILLLTIMANGEQEIFRLNKKIKELLTFSEKSKFQLSDSFVVQIM